MYISKYFREDDFCSANKFDKLWSAQQKIYFEIDKKSLYFRILIASKYARP